MNPILIVKTLNGYAVLPFEQDLPHVSFDKMRCFEEIGSAYSGSQLLSYLKAYFEPPKEGPSEAYEKAKVYQNA